MKNDTYVAWQSIYLFLSIYMWSLYLSIYISICDLYIYLFIYLLLGVKP